MVTTIKNRNGVLYCAKCRMVVQDLNRSYCHFCGSEFSNWEEIALAAYDEELKLKIKEGVLDEKEN